MNACIAASGDCDELVLLVDEVEPEADEVPVTPLCDRACMIACMKWEPLPPAPRTLLPSLSPSESPPPTAWVALEVENNEERFDTLDRLLIEVMI
jgi:hypothetical protein